MMVVWLLGYIKYCVVSLLSEISAKYLETSAKTGHNIETLFMMIAEDFVSITRQKNQANRGEPSTPRLK